jgi:hypothetical protein
MYPSCILFLLDSHSVDVRSPMMAESKFAGYQSELDASVKAQKTRTVGALFIPVLED